MMQLRSLRSLIAAIVHHLAGKGGGCEPASGQLISRGMGSEMAPQYPVLDDQKSIVVGRPIRGSVLLRLDGMPRKDGTYDLRMAA